MTSFNTTLTILFACTLLWGNTIMASAKTSKGVKGISREHQRQPRRIDEVKQPKKRDCKLDEKDKDGIIEEVAFKCSSKVEDETTEIKDKISFKVKSDDGVKVKVEYEQEVEDATTETETETQYEIYFDRVIEYQKMNMDDATATDDDFAYNWDTDNVIQEMSLGTLGGFSNVVNDADNITSTFSIASTDGVAMFSFTISRADVNENIRANSIKIDFSLTSFPWMETDSYVALICSVESKKKIEVEYEDGQDEVTGTKSKKTEDVIITFGEALDGTGIVPFGEYTWANEAYVDNNSTEVRVVATSPVDSEMIAFSFVGDDARSAMDLYWDPEAGIGYTSSASTFILIGSTIVGLVGAISAILF